MKIAVVTRFLALFPAVFAAIQTAPEADGCNTLYHWTSTSQIEATTYTSTTTSTSTKNTFYVTSTITSGTATIPTPDGFTPIIAESIYVSSLLPYTSQLLPRSPQVKTPVPDHVVTLDNDGHPTYSGTLHPVKVICTSQATRTRTTTMHIGSHARSTTTVTRTTTAIVPASTVYAACASDNIAYQGLGDGAGRAINEVTYYNSSGFTDITAITPYDCCVACQTIPGCAFSAWNFNLPFPGCDLSFVTQCDGSTWGGSYFTYQTPDQGNYTVEQGFWMSNGACGQVVYGGASG